MAKEDLAKTDLSYHVIAVLSGKGGVSKSFSALSVAQQLAIWSPYQNVLYLDLDPSLEGSDCKIDIELRQDPTSQNTILNAFRVKKPCLDDCYTETHEGLPSNLYVAACSTELEFVDRLLFSERNPDHVLKKLLKQAAGKFRYVVIDGPPNRGSLVSNAICACDCYFTPWIKDPKAVKGVLAMETLVDELLFDGILKKKPIDLGALETRWTKKRTVLDEKIQKLTKNFKKKLPMKIPEFTRVGEAICDSVSLQYGKNKVSTAYQELTLHIAKKLKFHKDLTI